MTTIVHKAILNLLTDSAADSRRGVEVANSTAGLPSHEAAARLYCDRRRRDTWFNPGLFWEPAWDILLYVFDAHEGGQRRVSFASIEDAPFAISPESVERWLELLAEHGYLLLHRVSCEPERISSIELTISGRRSMIGYLGDAVSLTA